MDENIIVTFTAPAQGITKDLEVSLDMTAQELIEGLTKAFGLGINLENSAECYLAAEQPIVLLRGNRTLRQLRLHNGTMIYFNRLRAEGSHEGI